MKIDPISYTRIHEEDIGQFIALIRLFEDVFEMKDLHIPGPAYLRQLLRRDDFISFVALSDNKVVGGLTAYVLHQYYSTRPYLYIFDLAVDRKWQRRGIGSALMEAVRSHARQTGMEEVFVQADLADQHALDFYRSTGGRAEEVIHFTYPGSKE